MSETDEFTQPDPAELALIRQDLGTRGTDRDLGGIDVTHEYTDEDGRLGATLAAWAQVLTYAKSFLGLKPPGWVKENVNSFTKKYYGNNTQAAWCFIFVWCVLNHFFKTAWKLAYVPWINKIKGEKTGHSGIKPGAITAIASYSHVGFFVTDLGDYFDLLSGNSVSGNSDDAITIKRYKKSVISAFVNVEYGPAAPPPAPATKMPIPSPKLVVDGETGAKTYRALQAVLAFHLTTALYLDGSFNAATKKALQKYLKVAVDGQIGPKTIRALQKKLNAGTF